MTKAEFEEKREELNDKVREAIEELNCSFEQLSEASNNNYDTDSEVNNVIDGAEADLENIKHHVRYLEDSINDLGDLQDELKRLDMEYDEEDEEEENMENKSTEEYVIGILFPTDNETTIKYVTEVQTDPKVAKWEDGKEAKTFSKDYANDLVFGLCTNGYPAISIIKTGCLLLKNPEKKTEANFENNTKKEEDC